MGTGKKFSKLVLVFEVIEDRDAFYLELKYPKLRECDFEVKSPRTRNYNCIAWAAGEDSRPWWPVAHENHPPYYWPVRAVDETLEDFINGFEAIGYQLCEDDTLEPEYEKVAIYMRDGDVSHMARQETSGLWTSKCGNLNDIIHSSLEGLCGDDGQQYGKVVRFMKRLRTDERIMDD